jgi:hypothetical protein
MRISALVSTVFFAATTGVSTMQAQDLGGAVVPVYSKMVGESLPLLMTATAVLMEARGSKDEAAALRAQAEDMKKGVSKPDKDLLERSMKATSESNNKFVASLGGEAKALTAEQRTMFVAGAVAYFAAVKSSREVAQMLPPVTTAIADVTKKGPLAIARAGKDLVLAKAVAQGIPELIKGNVQAAEALKNYIVANKIPVDASAIVF